MSATSIEPISATSAELPLKRPLSRRRCPPAIVVGLMIFFLVLLRLPSTLLPRELCADESQALAGAMKFVVDPRPWLAFDGGSWGPINSYLFSIFLLMGTKPSFVLMHLVATILVCLQVIVAYLTIRRFGSREAAILGSLLMVLIYGLPTDPGFSLHYGGELLPVLLLMLAFYLFVRWIDQLPSARQGSDLIALFVAGLTMGTAPWCKLQSAPIAAALGALFLAAIVWRRGSDRPLSWRAGQAIVFCAGALFTTCVILMILAKIGGLRDFWYSYVRGNVVHAGPANWTRSIAWFVMLWVVTPLNQILLISIAMVACMTRTEQVGNKQVWKTAGIAVYAGASLLAICRVQRLYVHHAIFLVPPMIYVLADLASRSVGWGRTWRSSATLRAAMVVFAAAIILLYGAYAVRYAYMIKGIRALSRNSVASMIGSVPDSPVPRFRPLDYVVGPSQWVLPDWNERIAFVVAEIQQRHRVQTLMVWGAAPAVYPLTGIAPATRYAVAAPVKGGPLQTYYTSRLLSDLRAKPPDLFIDTVSEAVRRADFTENDGYESIPELREFVDNHYTLIETLPVVKGSRPVRFFLRRSS